MCLEAAIRGPGGNVLPLGGEDAPDCHLACINNPAFRDLVARVLTEVFSEYGPDGLYLDGGGPYRCFCPHCREKFRRMFGHEMPVEKLAHIPDRDIWVWEMVEPAGASRRSQRPRLPAVHGLP